MRLRSMIPGFILLACVASPAGAQLRVGGNVGWLFDTDEDQFSIGGDARYPVADKRWVLNPRVTYYLFSEGFSQWQLDANVLYRFPVAASERVEPYMGAGAAFINYSFTTGTVKDSESKVGVNLVSGIEFKTTSKIKPYVHAVYTAAQDYGNTFVAFFGATFQLGR